MKLVKLKNFPEDSTYIESTELLKPIEDKINILPLLEESINKIKQETETNSTTLLTLTNLTSDYTILKEEISNLKKENQLIRQQLLEIQGLLQSYFNNSVDKTSFNQKIDALYTELHVIKDTKTTTANTQFSPTTTIVDLNSPAVLKKIAKPGFVRYDASNDSFEFMYKDGWKTI